VLGLVKVEHSLFNQVQMAAYCVMYCYSMEGLDLCQEIVKRASSGFVYSEAVARYAVFI
jgi:hypothetical protein